MSHSTLQRPRRNLRRIRFFLISIVAVFGISLLISWLGGASGDLISSAASPLNTRSQAELQEAYQRHVDTAIGNATTAVNTRSAELASFIDSRKIGAKPFASEIISWYGKWRAVAPFLPFTSKEGHKEYIEEMLERHVFTKVELASALQSSVGNSVRDIEGIENMLAVSLRTEILGRSLSPDETHLATEEFRSSIDHLVTASQRDAAMATGSLVAAEVTSQVMTQVLIRLGVSTGLLAAGGVNAWWSFGGAMVIGVLADMAWGYFQDPQGDIENELIRALDDLSLRTSAAVNDEMSKVIAQRGQFWNKKIKEIAL